MNYDRKTGVLIFEKGLEELDIHLNDLQMEQFINYYELLIEKNKVMNLTAITDFNEVIYKHFLDSLSIVKVCRPTKEKMLDMGTGAGFPGIPLKIAFPDIKVVLMDSLNKRVKFLEEVIRKLQLDNITALHGRAEEYGAKTGYRERFNICTSRAVAKLSTLTEYCIPFVAVGGMFISYKSGNISHELSEAAKAISTLGGRVVKAEEFKLPHTDMQRSLILIEKKSTTPNKYPRPAGKPSKEPIM